MFVVIVSAAVVLNLKKKDFMLLPEKIEQLMNSTPMKCYKNSFMDIPYTIPLFLNKLLIHLLLTLAAASSAFGIWYR